MNTFRHAPLALAAALAAATILPGLTMAQTASDALQSARQGKAGSAIQAPADVAKVQANLQSAMARIEASPTDRAALIEAVKSGDQRTIRSILVKNGANASDVSTAQMEMKDDTRGAAANARGKVSITIEASCCPLKIVITIRF